MRLVLTTLAVACAALSLAACGRDSDEREATETQAAPNMVVTEPAEPANTVAAAPKPAPQPTVAAAATAPADAQMAEDAAATGMTSRSTSTTTTTTTSTTTQPATAQ